MNFRFTKIWLAISFFSGAAGAANNASWNCVQSQGGEWTCLNQGQAASETPKQQPVVPEKSKTADAVKQPEIAELPATQSADQSSDIPKARTLAPVVAEPVKPQPAAAAVAKVTEKTIPDSQKLHVKINEKPLKDKQLAVERETASSASAVASASNTPGWNCKTGGETKSWDCNLVGPDPQGEARVVAATEVSASLLKPTFSASQERLFQTLRGEFDQDPWRGCETWSKKRRKPKPLADNVRETAETIVNADSSELFEGDVISFAGNVDLNRADQHLMADQASYDTAAETMDAQGHVIYSEQNLAFSSDTASISLGKDEARLRNAQFIAAEAPIRGNAAVVYRDSKILSRYHETTFTSCAPGNQDWMIHASRLKINKESGQGSAKNAWLEFKGVPALYTPYISFPVDNRRLSGFLSPNWASTQRNGFDTSIPFYWNMAPNYDMTITPRYLAKRGGMIRDKFRYLTDHSTGTISAEYMPNDDIKNTARYLASIKDKTQFTQHLSSDLNLNYVSDNTYFNDLNNALGVQTSSYLPSTAFLNYARPDVSFAAGIQHFQSVDKAMTDAMLPYSVLPRVNLNLSHGFETLPVNLGIDNQYSYFSHTTLDNGQRVNIAPYLSLPLESTAGFFIPKITGNYTQYQFNSIQTGRPDNVTRTLPVFSVDSGMGFEKDLNFGDSSYTHTLEPRVFYLYIPRKDQSNIPLFDTSILDTNFYSLFRENRFSGYDRIQDANQLTLSATSRFIDNKTGLEPVRLSLGQIVYFQGRNVDLYDQYYKYSPGYNSAAIQNIQNPQSSKTSNFIGEISGQYTRTVSYKTGAQWDPDTNSLARGEVGLKYREKNNEVFDVGYRYRQKNPYFAPNGISQTDMSFRWPLWGEWYGLGRWQYSLNFDKTTESFVGLEKENCCWRLRFLARRFINGYSATTVYDPNLPNTLKPETAFFVQLELKGLSSFGDDVDSFLQRNLNGYRKAGYYE